MDDSGLFVVKIVSWIFMGLFFVEEVGKVYERWGIECSTRMWKCYIEKWFEEYIEQEILYIDDC